ncbi:MAG: relaxase/mobilization nuclease domain-containing protein [Sphingobacteriaceae bacterium]|nr:relaxase/mobilization nuclease domain-containing protein [Sphingobacteriaceae bacterium]
MVAKIITGKHIRGILCYNEHKVEKGIAKLLTAENFFTDASRLSFTNKLSQFEAFTEKNRRTKTNAIHISLNFDNTDKLDDKLIAEIGSRYMAAIGFDEQPYLLYRHHDAAHPHIHIVTTNIQSNGERIDLHNIGKNQSEIARKELEKEYGLVQAESKRQVELNQLKEIDVLKALYGKHETKQAISNVVRYVVRNWKYTSLPELNAILNQYNVSADRGPENSKMFEKNGLVYYLLDNGKKIGVPIKASSIYGKPTLKFLESRYKLNEQLRLPFKVQLKNNIDGARLHPSTKNEFEKQLKAKGVQVLFRQNAEGKIYGVTFTDHLSKSVFNGSDLGKSYSAKAITDCFVQKPESKVDSTSVSTEKHIKNTNLNFFLEGSHSTPSSLLDGLLKTEYDGMPIGMFQNQRKKKKRRLNR